ncbi:Hypothetical_protein [Hexamita inflata]|uniref:Hypothetical_protein n=1 Tax=Hexamita inflata TaxID=28002 RepID=A0AA86TZH2_9EUKA|nr:Hypothetical protein HINF_LOCUS23550 [Hexamita inflata]
MPLNRIQPNIQRKSNISLNRNNSTHIHNIVKMGDSASQVLEFQQFTSIFEAQFIRELKIKIAEVRNEFKRVDYLVLYDKRNKKLQEEYIQKYSTCNKKE